DVAAEERPISEGERAGEERTAALRRRIAQEVRGAGVRGPVHGHAAAQAHRRAHGVALEQPARQGERAVDKEAASLRACAVADELRVGERGRAGVDDQPAGAPEGLVALKGHAVELPAVARTRAATFEGCAVGEDAAVA